LKTRFHKPFGLFLPFLLLLGAAHVPARAQTNPRDRLERLRSEVDSLATVLTHYRQSESDLSGKVRALDQQVQARQRLIEELEAQRVAEQRQVRRYDGRIEERQGRLRVVRRELHAATEEVGELEELVARRAAYLYKRGGHDALRFLAAAESPGDLVRRRVYVQRIARRDGRNLEALREARDLERRKELELERTITDLRDARRRRADAVARIELLAEEAEDERLALVEDRHEKRLALGRVRRSRESVQELIEQRRAAMRQVENWIAQLEQQRASGEVQEVRVDRRPAEAVVREVPEFESFPSAKGKLPWPVEGPVLSRFGIVRNRAMGTETENPGIDIGAGQGSEVIAVQPGVCKHITYMRGFGTIILVEHGGGYYTVYAHMGEVYVSEGERVQGGRVLGTVGRPSVGEESRLHFQIWNKRRKQDPMPWLG
jgi:septal ring factor EnvC (AmiA/AmiB activator)